MATIEDVCCTEPEQCVDGPPSNADPCSLACASTFAPLYDECHEGLAAMGVELDPFYATCLEALYKPGQCGTACTPATLNCRLAELNQACCSVPGACTDGALVPRECSVECALIAVPFEAECTPLLGLNAGQAAALHAFAHDTCTAQDLTEIVEYGFDLFSQGCTIEFGTVPPQAGGWVSLSAAQLASASCTLVAGSEARAVVDPSGRMDFFNFQESAENSGVLRCDIEMPTTFTKVRGSYAVNPTVPPSATPGSGAAGHNHSPGDPTDPDNNYEITNWGDDPPGHAGSFVFGTEHDIVDRGSQMGTDDSSFTALTTITIPETVVTRSRIVRFEMCQSADHEDFSLEQVSIQVRVSKLTVPFSHSSSDANRYRAFGTIRSSRRRSPPRATWWLAAASKSQCARAGTTTGRALRHRALRWIRARQAGPSYLATWTGGPIRWRATAKLTVHMKACRCSIPAAAQPVESSR